MMMDRTFVPVPPELLAGIDGEPTWSDAVRVGKHVYCTGQVGWDKSSGKIVEGGIQPQTRRALENLKETLSRVGATLADVVIVRVYLLDKDDHDPYDEVYQQFFPQNPPARVTVAVHELCDEGSLIDIEAEAVVG